MQVASRAENAQAQEYGNYLSARFAASQHNLKDAAAYYRASADANPKERQLTRERVQCLGGPAFASLQSRDYRVERGADAAVAQALGNYLRVNTCTEQSPRRWSRHEAIGGKANAA